MTSSNGTARNGRGRPIRPGRGSSPAKEIKSQVEDLERIAALDEQHYQKMQARGDGYGSIGSTYLAGESNRMNPTPAGVDPLGSDADYHYRTERSYFLMIERARSAVRNHPLVEQAVNRLIANLRLSQIRLDPNTGDRNIDREIREAWEEWSCDKMACDWEQQRDFGSLICQSFFNEVVDGDILHLPLTTGQIQTWEAHHIRTPYGHVSTGQSQDGIIHGAEVRNGRTIGWHVTPFHLGYRASLTRGAASKFFRQFDDSGNQIAFYAGFTHRFQMRRGVSRLSPPRDAMNGFDDLNYAHIKSALRRSLISYLMKSNQPAGPPGLDGGELPKGGDRYTQDVGLGLESIIVEQSGEPAQVFKAPEGYDITGWNSNMPGSGYFEQASLLLTLLAVNLDLPLSFLLLDGSLVNFHGGRMTFDQVKLRMQDLQRHVISTRHWPMYQWMVRQWTTEGSPNFKPRLARAMFRERRPVDLMAVKFRPKGWPYVKPLEDAHAEHLAESNNLKSRRAILAERGEDIDDVDAEIIGDRAARFRMSIDAARELVQENDDLNLDIMQVASELRHGSGSPTGVQLTLAAGEDEPPQATTRTGGDDA